MAIGDYICLDFNTNNSFVSYVPAGTDVIMITCYGFYDQGFMTPYNQHSTDNPASFTGGDGYLGGTNPRPGAAGSYNFSATPAPNVKAIFNNSKYLIMHGNANGSTSVCGIQVA